MRHVAGRDGLEAIAEDGLSVCAHAQYVAVEVERGVAAIKRADNVDVETRHFHVDSFSALDVFEDRFVGSAYHVEDVYRVHAQLVGNFGYDLRRANAAAFDDLSPPARGFAYDFPRALDGIE